MDTGKRIKKKRIYLSGVLILVAMCIIGAGESRILSANGAGVKDSVSENVRTESADTGISGGVEGIFTEEESAYIRECGSIQVALYTDFNVICEYDSKKGSFSGVVPDIINLISEKTGIVFEFVPYDPTVRAVEYFNTNKGEIVAPVFRSGLVTLSELVVQSNVITESSVCFVAKKGETVDFSGNIRIALSKQLFSMDAGLKEMYPNAEIVICEDRYEAFDMIITGEADVTVDDELMLMYWLQNPFYERLEILDAISIDNEMIMVLSQNADPRLYGIIDKAISMITPAELNQIIVNNTIGVVYKLSFTEWMYKYRNQMTLIFVLILIAVTGVVFVLRNKKELRIANEEKRIEFERRKADDIYREKLFRQANYDDVTGLYNQKYFLQKVEEMLKEAPDEKYVMISFNIDNFRMINNMCGWAAGDEVLRAVANRLREDMDGRAVYAKAESSYYTVCGKADVCDYEKLCENYSGVYKIAGNMIKLSFHAGVYLIEDNSEDVSKIIERALFTLQSITDDHRVQWSIYSDELMKKFMEYNEITEEMDAALSNGEFEIFLQVQYNHKEMRYIGAEALVRWKHPKKGFISPGIFIPVFESNGFVSKLDRFVWEEACKTLRKWKDEGVDTIPISVNISRNDIVTLDLESVFTELVEKYDIDRKLLHLEITETAYVDNTKEVIDMVKRLRAKDFVIAMDDFGSGYSSLNMLANIEVDILKLDMRFMQNTENLQHTGSILKAVVNMADGMGMHTIAEGVETEGQADFLSSIGCDIIQGYLYGKPAPVVDVEKQLLGREKAGIS